MGNEKIHVAIFGGPSEVPQLESVLMRYDCMLHRVTSEEELFDAVESYPVDLVLLILSKGHPERLALLRAKHASYKLPPVVVLTDCFDVDLYVEALRLGAFDGLGVPLDSKELLRVIRAAVAEGRSQRKELPATA